MPKGTAISAGGIILREIGGELKIALARDSDRPDVWVLPKGHVAEGESIKQAALREIREEVGLDKIQLIKYLGTIVRQSVEDWGEVVQKTIHMYLAYALGNDEFKDLEDSSLTEAGWFSLQQALLVIPFAEDRAFLSEQLAPMLES